MRASRFNPGLDKSGRAVKAATTVRVRRSLARFRSNERQVVMDVIVFPSEESPAVLRMLKTVACGNARFTAAEADFVRGVAVLQGARVDPCARTDRAKRGRPGDSRSAAAQRLQLAIIVALIEGAPDHATNAAARAFAAALDVDERGLDVLDALAAGRTMHARVRMARRISRALKLDFRAFISTLASVLGLVTDSRLAARYRALGEMPQDTLGHALFVHYREHGFAFPGEYKGIAARACSTTWATCCRATGRPGGRRSSRPLSRPDSSARTASCS